MNNVFLETNILHASDVIYWLDATSGVNHVVSDMLRVAGPMSVDFTQQPSDMQYLHKGGSTALWRRPTTPMVDGLASEAERSRPAVATFTVTGVVRDVGGLINPRRFEVTVGSGDGHAVLVYPSPKGTTLGKGGGLVGSLRFHATGEPAAWALVELEVETTPNTEMQFRAQANGKGDFRLAMSRLPPLPENVDDYEAKLRVKALVGASESVPIDPVGLVEMELGELDEEDEFESEIELHVKPSEVLRVRSFERDHLVVKPD